MHDIHTREINDIPVYIDSGNAMVGLEKVPSTCAYTSTTLKERFSVCLSMCSVKHGHEDRLDTHLLGKLTFISQDLEDECVEDSRYSRYILGTCLIKR